MNPDVVACVFARGGSKGIPKKNVRKLCGKPLIAYAIETARAVPLIHQVIVSTDDPEIAEIAKTFGAEVPFLRPKELAEDHSPEWLAWQHAIQHLKQSGSAMDVFVSIPTTSPLRQPGDVSACIERLLKGDVDIVVTVREAERNPYFNMVTLDEKQHAHLVIHSKEGFYGRQAAPPVYDMTTVAYAARPEFILKARSIFEGQVGSVLIPRERAMDIDTEFDFQLAEYLLKRRHQ